MKKIGKGIIRKNNITYDGYFENDVFSGTGILEQINSKGQEQTYYGEFSDGKFNGVGVLTIMNRNRRMLEYQGQFKNG